MAGVLRLSQSRLGNETAKTTTDAKGTLLNATKGQVTAIRQGVTDNGRRLGLIHDGVDGIDEGVRQLHEDNERQTEALVEIRDRL